jgi:hypothetical protein
MLGFQAISWSKSDSENGSKEMLGVTLVVGTLIILFSGIEIAALVCHSCIGQIASLFNQFFGGYRVERDYRPILTWNDCLVPDIRWNGNPSSQQFCATVTDEKIRFPTTFSARLEIARPAQRHHPLVTVRMPFRAGCRSGTENKDPA